jgi:hypothetical protein
MRALIIQAGYFRPRVERFLQMLAQSAPRHGVNCRWDYYSQPFKGLLIAYGTGRPDMAKAVATHLASGQPALCWDVGYWGKTFRCAWNAQHPLALPEGDASRWDSQGIALRDDYDPEGPIVLVGLGPKSRYMGPTWEQDALQRIRAAYPGRRVLYRPKPRRDYVQLPVDTDWTSPIESVLRGAALVVTRHSNVGVDACIAGIPCVAEMGAPALLYGNDLTTPRRPSPAERLDFLRRLAWLNWQDSEAQGDQLWPWIKRCAATLRFHIG